MRICLYTETALPTVGGQELAIDALARRFLLRGHEVVVVTQRPRHGQPGDDSPLPYPVVRHRRYLSTRYFLGFYERSLSRVQRRYPFDVLHCHNVYPAGHVASRWAVARNVPLVITSHACDVAEDSPLLKKPHVPQRVAQVLREAAAAIAISDAVANQFERLSGGTCRVVRMTNGVDLDVFREPAARPDELSPAIRPRGYFLFLGRLVWRKGVDLLLDAFQRIAPATTADLVIAGTGEQQGDLQARAESAGLRSRVHFVGLAHGPTKTYLLQNALGTVIPSRISEGSSLVVLESAAAGVPIIAARIPGLAEAIQPQRTGLLVPPESAADLAGALAAVAAEPGRAASWGAGARRAVEAFDWRHIAERHLELYAGVLKSRTGAARSRSWPAGRVPKPPAAAA